MLRLSVLIVSLVAASLLSPVNASYASLAAEAILHVNWDQGPDVAVADASSSGLALTPTGYNSDSEKYSTDRVQGLFSGEFDGTDDYYTIGSNTFGGAVTIAGWARYAGQGQGNVRVIELASDNNNVVVSSPITTTGTLLFTIYPNSGTPRHVETDGSFFVANEWVHFVVTIDSSGVPTIYRNGASVNIASGGGAGVTPLTTVRALNFLGNTNFPDDDLFKGQMDDVMVINRHISAAEALELYEHGAVSHGFKRCKFTAYCQGGTSTLNVVNTAEGATAYERNTCVELATDFSLCRIDAYTSIGLSTVTSINVDATPVLYFQTSPADASISCSVGTTRGANDVSVGASTVVGSATCTLLEATSVNVIV